MIGHQVAILTGGSSIVAESLWRALSQGSAAILLVWLLCRSFPRLTPRIQCWLWRLAYLKLVVALVWASPIPVPLLPSKPAAVVQSAATPRGPAGVPAASHPDLHNTSRPFGPDGANLRAGDQLPSDSPLARASSNSALQGNLQAAAKILHIVLSALVFVWLLGAGWFSLRLVQEWKHTRTLWLTCQPVTNGQVLALFGELCRKFRLRAEPELAVSDAIRTPLVIGMIRPTVIVPACLLPECGPPLHSMVAHELAHVKRKDLLWNWLLMIAQVFLYFNPLVWAAKREWQVAQESATDELALAVTQTPVVEYGQALLQAATWNRRPFAGELSTLGAIGPYQTLRRRILAMQYFRPISRSRLLTAAASLAALAVLGIVPWRVVAKGSLHAAAKWLPPGHARNLVTLVDTRVAAEDAAAPAADASGGTPIEPQVGSNIPISGQVIGNETGKPMAGVTVSLMDGRDGHPVSIGQSLVNGSFLLRAPRIGTYHLLVTQGRMVLHASFVQVDPKGLASLKLPALMPPASPIDLEQAARAAELHDQQLKEAQIARDAQAAAAPAPGAPMTDRPGSLPPTALGPNDIKWATAAGAPMTGRPGAAPADLAAAPAEEVRALAGVRVVGAAPAAPAAASDEEARALEAARAAGAAPDLQDASRREAARAAGAELDILDARRREAARAVGAAPDTGNGLPGPSLLPGPPTTLAGEVNVSVAPEDGLQIQPDDYQAVADPTASVTPRLRVSPPESNGFFGYGWAPSPRRSRPLRRDPAGVEAFGYGWAPPPAPSTAGR